MEKSQLERQVEQVERKLAPLCELNNLSDKMEHLVRRTDGRLWAINESLIQLNETMKIISEALLVSTNNSEDIKRLCRLKKL